MMEEHLENEEIYESLKVTKGVTAPTVNPYIKQILKRRVNRTAADYVEGILKGDIAVL